ncbi:MAG: S8 family serine peptidase [Acidobacteriota bacterium]
MSHQPQRAGLTPRVVTIPVLLAAILLVAPLQAQDLSGDGLSFHQTDNPVLEQRSIAVPGSALELHLWQEILPSGKVQSFYAVSEGGSLRGRVRPTTYDINLRDHRFDPTVADLPQPSTALTARSDNRLQLVQFHTTPLPEFRRAIEAAGGTVWRFLSDHTFIVDIAPQDSLRLATMPFVRWVGAYHPSYRLDQPLRQAIEGQSSQLAPQRYSIMIGQRGTERQNALAEAIRDLGANVEMIGGGGLRIEATLTQDQLAEVAHNNLVQFIDPWGGPAQVDMDAVRELGGANYIETVEGFTGQGVRGEIFDTETLLTHQEWLNAPMLHSVAASCSVLHGTSCYSNVFAQGTNAAARGMLPDGQGIFFCSSEAQVFGGATSRYDANEELINPAGPYRAVFQTSSVGSSRTTQYTTISAETDDYLFLHQILSTQSQSNAGDQMSRPQAWAKNIVAVGGMLHDNTFDRCDDNWNFTASIGPAADGRIKPDVAFFYDSIFSAQGSNNTAYTNFGGTSSATPQTAGHFGLFFQMWHEGVWAGFGGAADVFDSRPHMSTAKAIVINSAHKYEWLTPGACDFDDVDRDKQGWGTADVRKMYDRAASTFVIDESDIITPLETKTYDVTVEDGETELACTLVFTDPMGTPGAAEARVNDLSLRVTSPSATAYWGNNGLRAGNVSTAGGVSNTIDTVENVFVLNPEAGTWTVEVIGDEIVQDSHTETPALDADFALVCSGVQGVMGDQIFADGFESNGTTNWSTVVQ